MSKTLVIAEKPSVGRDLAGALDGAFQRRKLEDIAPKRRRKSAEEAVEEAVEKPTRSRSKDEAVFLESDDYVITWAVGHLVELAQPEDYDEKLKKWRMADLPIVPDDFRLKPRDAKSKKQRSAILKLLARPDVDRVINACDAGREGELIFAYTIESAGIEKPVQRLWLNSMTKKAIEEAFAHLRDGGEMELLEPAARSR